MNIINKLLLSIILILGFLFSQVLAQPPAHAKGNNIKQKHLPYGLQKKLKRTGQLPPGWQKKISAGEVVSNRVLESGVILRPPYWETHPYSKNSDIYEVQDKIFRVNRATREILDVFK